MARSKAGGRRSPGRAPASPPDPVGSAVDTVAAPTLASATLPRVWQGVGYRPLADPAAARPLFEFAAVSWPEGETLEPSWGAHVVEGAGERLIGAGVGQRAGAAAMLHGPVVVTEDEPLEVATQLVSAWLDHATALGVETVFARPQGLDRVWVRFGFIPVPEGALPHSLSGSPSVGLYSWRGGSALWSFREAPRA